LELGDHQQLDIEPCSLLMEKSIDFSHHTTCHLMDCTEHGAILAIHYKQAEMAFDRCAQVAPLFFQLTQMTENKEAGDQLGLFDQKLMLSLFLKSDI